MDARFTTRAELDIGDATQVNDYVATFGPDLIVNAAAYTAVDKAESDEAGAVRINTNAPRYLAEAASRTARTRMIHISTDFVFDGAANSPYQPGHPVAPLGAYGRTKAGGEAAVLQILGAKALVVRTAWVYAAAGHNFFRTMLRLLRERGEVSVVDDQIGTPTSAGSLAAVLWRFAVRPELSGVFHWTDAGVASWYDFAVAIAEEATAAGALQRDVKVNPIDTAGYPTPAKRPRYSVLEKRSTCAALGIQPVHWRKQLRVVMQEALRA
jgi:dTDP-4-dehydrorhamnose reductase